MKEIYYDIHFNIGDEQTLERVYKNHTEMRNIGEISGITYDQAKQVVKRIPQDIRYQFIVIEKDLAMESDDSLDEILAILNAEAWLESQQ
jgi:hypothetical protein